MKKTIISILLAMGFAAGASADTTYEALNAATVGFTDFSTKTADVGKYKDSLTVTAGDDSVTLTLPETTPFSVSDSRNAMSFTLVLDASKLGDLSDTILLTAAIRNGYTWGGGIDSDGKAHGVWAGSFYQTTTSPLLSDVASTDGTLTLTFTTSNAGTVIYVNDTQYLPSSNGLKFDKTTVTSISVSASSAIKQLYVFDTTLSADDVANVYRDVQAVTAASIPEPTTATLSLLALAGLAARRRRK